MRFARLITKATHMHLEYEILIAFPRQKWLRDRAPQYCVLGTLPVLSLLAGSLRGGGEGVCSVGDFGMPLRIAECYDRLKLCLYVIPAVKNLHITLGP
jgi:hypothetical protein